MVGADMARYSDLISSRMQVPTTKSSAEPKRSDLDGLVAIVTGGSRGIGHAIVGALADEGSSVMFCGRDPEVGGQAEQETDSEGQCRLPGG